MFYHERFISSLVQRTCACRATFCMYAAGVCVRNAMHENTHVAVVSGVERKMPMIWHESVCKYTHACLLLCLREQIKKQLILSRRTKYASTANGAIQDMVWHITNIDTSRTGHACIIALTVPVPVYSFRRIKYRDAETGIVYVFLTNNFSVPPSSIALLYKHRWQIELFFKWIKQHFKIKAFWGHSENAVKTQICIALCTYLIVAILKKRLHIERNLYEILQILSVSLFDRSGVVALFSRVPLQNPVKGSENTALLFDF